MVETNIYYSLLFLHLKHIEMLYLYYPKNLILLVIAIFSFTTSNTQTSIYDVAVNDICGNSIDLYKFKGKHMLFVNVASECGFTKQYKGLEELHQQFKDDLIVIGFILLTVSLLSGAPFILGDNNFFLMQKIIFSLIAWITFAYLLFKRFSSGVRGKKAAHLTLSGITFLFIAYLGTRLFFELL